MFDTLLHHSLLSQFSSGQIAATLLIFIWSGFVRSGLGFGGAALGLPLMLMVYDQPLFWLPVVGLHLLLFTALTLIKRIRDVDWHYLLQSSAYIFPAKLAGVFGLLNLPNTVLVVLIYTVTLLYAVMWLLEWQFHGRGGWRNRLMLVLGGYISGTSLTGAPLIVAVYMQHVSLAQLRNTLFVLWFVLVAIKLATLAALGVSLQTLTALLLVPMAAIGHVIGLKAHQAMLHNDRYYKRILGGILIVICLLGLWRSLAH